MYLLIILVFHSVILRHTNLYLLLNLFIFSFIRCKPYLTDWKRTETKNNNNNKNVHNIQLDLFGILFLSFCSFTFFSFLYIFHTRYNFYKLVSIWDFQIISFFSIHIDKLWSNKFFVRCRHFIDTIVKCTRFDIHLNFYIEFFYFQTNKKKS